MYRSRTASHRETLPCTKKNSVCDSRAMLSSSSAFVALEEPPTRAPTFPRNRPACSCFSRKMCAIVPFDSRFLSNKNENIIKLARRGENNTHVRSTSIIYVVPFHSSMRLVIPTHAPFFTSSLPFPTPPTPPSLLPARPSSPHNIGHTTLIYKKQLNNNRARRDARRCW